MAGLEQRVASGVQTVPGPRVTFAAFAEFYPYYLSEHRNRSLPPSAFHRFAGGDCGDRHRDCHRRGVVAVVAPVGGYGLAWIGHFFFERNRPATFSRPWYSLVGDWVMFRDLLAGKLPF